MEAVLGDHWHEPIWFNTAQKPAQGWGEAVLRRAMGYNGAHGIGEVWHC